uniref:Uncharacterized protein n=1 Tax=Triticum urartu TaxID=4572 RepID=A0A8R7PGW2_TRIUA
MHFIKLEFITHFGVKDISAHYHILIDCEQYGGDQNHCGSLSYDPTVYSKAEFYN